MKKKRLFWQLSHGLLLFVMRGSYFMSAPSAQIFSGLRWWKARAMPPQAVAWTCRVGNYLQVYNEHYNIVSMSGWISDPRERHHDYFILSSMNEWLFISLDARSNPFSHFTSIKAFSYQTWLEPATLHLQTNIHNHSASTISDKRCAPRNGCWQAFFYTCASICRFSFWCSPHFGYGAPFSSEAVRIKPTRMFSFHLWRKHWAVHTTAQIQDSKSKPGVKVAVARKCNFWWNF